MNFPLSLQAPRAIRQSLENKYAKTMDRGLLDDVILMTSEAVTNSVVHSGRPDGDPISVSSNVTDGVLHVEIGDQGKGVANMSARSLDPPSGLGFLQILSDRWSSKQNNSFHVWFEIDITPRHDAHPSHRDLAPPTVSLSMPKRRGAPSPLPANGPRRACRKGRISGMIL